MLQRVLDDQEINARVVESTEVALNETNVWRGLARDVLDQGPRHIYPATVDAAPIDQPAELPIAAANIDDASNGVAGKKILKQAMLALGGPRQRAEAGAHAPFVVGVEAVERHRIRQVGSIHGVVKRTVHPKGPPIAFVDSDHDLAQLQRSNEIAARRPRCGTLHIVCDLLWRHGGNPVSRTLSIRDGQAILRTRTRREFCLALYPGPPTANPSSDCGTR